MGTEFLDTFLPSRKEVAVDYPVPMYANNTPSMVYSSASELMRYLEHDTAEEYLIYWTNSDHSSSYKHGMIFYTDDKAMIFGLSLSGDAPDSEEAITQYLNIKRLLSSNVGCITVEEVPPVNSVEFMNFCKNRYVP